MANLLKVIFPCLPIGEADREIQIPTDTVKSPFYEKSPHLSFLSNDEKPSLSTDEAASSIVSHMLAAEKAGPSFDLTIQKLVHQAGGWSEYLARKILNALEAVLKAGKQMSPVMQEAYDKACEAAKDIEGFAADHPIATAVFCTVIALGILVILAPFALEWLGFAELGPIEGSWAAIWQSTYRGYVSRRSLFAYFQRLGMTWKRV